MGGLFPFKNSGKNFGKRGFVFYNCKMEVKIVYESFTPSVERGEFYYRPSKKWNQLTFSDMKYTDYFLRVYGEIPQRINPVRLSLLDKDGGMFFEDFMVDLPENDLMGILDKGGDCRVELKGDRIYLKGKELKKCL